MNNEFDKRIIQQMIADEQQRTEALAARFRERLAVWTKRIKVFSGDMPFEYRFIFQGPSWHLQLSMALPPDSDTVPYIVNYVTSTIITDFEAKLWEKFKDVFEGRERSNRKLFHDMLWRPSEQHYNTGAMNVF